MSKVKFDVVFKCSSDGDSSVARFSADPIVTSFPFLNGNNFMFSPESLEKQASTMAHRPLNFMHNERDIIGHCIRCTTTKNLPKNVLEAGCNGLKVSGVFYKMLNRELYEDIVAAGDGGFKVSMEAITNKMEWVLYDGEEKSLMDTDSYEIVRPEQDPELHAIGRLHLWMFGTVRGLRYKDKNVAVMLGGQEGDLEFVGLALTDERMGPAAADQNTRFEFNATSIQSGEVTMESLCSALTSMNKDKLDEVGISVDDAKVILDQFEREFGEKLVEDVNEDSQDQEFDREYYVGDVRPLSVGSQVSSVVSLTCMGYPYCVYPRSISLSNESEPKLGLSALPELDSMKDSVEEIRNSIVESSAALKSIASLAQDRVDIERLQNESLKAKITELESSLDARVSEAREEFLVMAGQMNNEISCLTAKNKELEEEIQKLRTFELVCMGASIEFCKAKNLGSMSSSDYATMKSSLDFGVQAEKKSEIKVDFESQAKRICSK